MRALITLAHSRIRAVYQLSSNCSQARTLLTRIPCPLADNEQGDEGYILPPRCDTRKELEPPFVAPFAA